MAIILNKRLIIRAIITAIVLAMVVYIVRMLFFYPIRSEHKDILNVIIGAILGQVPTVINFWFKKDDEDKAEEDAESIQNPPH